jgi:integrase
MTTRETDEKEPPFELTREGHHRIRIRAGRRHGKSQQLWVTIATTDREVALERLGKLRELSAALTPQGLTAEASVSIKKAAEQTSELRFELMCKAALELAPEVRKKPRSTWSTFRELADAWTSGELHRRWPDHVAKKRSADVDKARLNYLCELIVDDKSPKRRLGELPLGEVTVDHAMAAMAQLPDECRRPATRRQYAQLIGRVLKLACFPTALIAVSPLPRNFLPTVPEGDLVFPHFYPDEDLRLMRCESIEYGWRVLFGLCNREGGRLGEFLRRLKWSGIDVRRGELRLPGGEFRKNGKPGVWQAEPGSIEALEPLRALGGEGPFTHLPDDRKWSDRLADMMRAAGLEREALYYSNVSEGFRRMRGHDTRATYITLALASGLAESHIMARTGHTTSKMVHRYDHAAEALGASDAGSKLMPLDHAVGLYRDRPPPGPRRAGWLTLDPLSAEASALERLALPAPRVLELGPGDDDPDGGGLRATVERKTPDAGEGRAVSSSEVVDGELVDFWVDVDALLDRAPRGVTAGAAARRASGPRGPVAHGQTSAPREGEMLGETNSGYSLSCHALSGKNGGMFSAVVRETGVEPARLAALEPKCGKSAHDGTPDELTTRNLVAGSDENAHGVSPETGPVRRESDPPDELDRVLASLRAAAHAAVDAGDAATVASLMAVIEERRARRAGAA